MQKIKLPLKIDPIRCAQKRLDYHGIYPKSVAKRLSESAADVLSDINVALSCFIDHQGLVVIKGKATVDVQLLCQRCLEQYTDSFEVSYCFTPERTKKSIENIPDEYELISVDEFGEIDLLDLIEDELILALPLVPAHDDLHCQFSVSNKVFGDIPEASESTNPFAMLSKLKK